tara:strand:+ start:1106 stop:1510 length:405 start_codon:yes stop_codon:yes gene_type:complete
MSWQLLIPAVIASTVAIIGWVIGHRLNAERDLKNSQRELRLKHLIRVYEVLLELGRNVDILGNYRDVEKAVHDIQLFGTPKHIELCRRFIGEIAENGKSDHTELTVEIRNFIRSELDLKIMDDKHLSLKITPKN